MIILFVIGLTSFALIIIISLNLFLTTMDIKEVKDFFKISICVISIMGFVGSIMNYSNPIVVLNESDFIETTPATMEVVEIDTENDIVYLVDPNGYRWSFEGVEDWFIGDLVSCTMDTKGIKSILDDEIKDKKYSGYNMR